MKRAFLFSIFAGLVLMGYAYALEPAGESVYMTSGRVGEKLSPINMTTAVERTGYGEYDLVVNWKIDAVKMATLFESEDTAMPALGVSVGVLLVAASTVGSEVHAESPVRHLVYEINGKRFGYIPASKCRLLHPLVQAKMTKTALQLLVTNMTLYK